MPGAPTRPAGGFRVVSRSERISPSAAAPTASRPSSAPVGTEIVPPCVAARSSRCGCSSSAPALRTTTSLPARRNGSAISGSRCAGAHSITRSASGSSSSIGATGTSTPSSRNVASAFVVVARGDGDQLEARHPGREPGDERATDGAESGDGDARHPAAATPDAAAVGRLDPRRSARRSRPAWSARPRATRRGARPPAGTDAAGRADPR